MTLEVKNEFGQVEIDNEVIAAIAGGTAIDCEGIFGMASKSQIKDGLTDILKKENFTKGIIVRQEDDDEIHIDMYIIVNYGVSIAEAARNIQNKVKETLNHTLGLSVSSINIYVQSVRVSGE